MELSLCIILITMAYSVCSVVKGYYQQHAIPKDNDLRNMFVLLQGYVPEPHTTYKHIKVLKSRINSLDPKKYK